MAILNWRIVAFALAALAGTMCPARTVDAHIVPIPPSICIFGPFGLTLSGGAVGGGAVGSPGKMRIVYDANASVLSLCALAPGGGSCGDSVAAPFSLGVTAGSLGFPARFGGVMESSGDIVLEAVPITVTVGTTAVTVPVTLTTGLVAAAGEVAEGAPLQGVDGWSLVGVIDGAGLPPPVGARPLVVTIPCVPRPIPDRDQFVPPSTVGAISGRIASAQARIRATVAVGQADHASLRTMPTIVALHVDGRTVAHAVVSGGLHGRRRLVGTSDDGRATLTVRPRSATELTVDILMRDVAVPGEALRARALVGLTIDAGGVLARGEALFRARPGGKLRRR
jgi:hypothetical protein